MRQRLREFLRRVLIHLGGTCLMYTLLSLIIVVALLDSLYELLLRLRQRLRPVPEDVLT